MGEESREAERAAFRDDAELAYRIIDAVPAGIVHVSADGSILSANPTALRVLGLGYDELTGRFTSDFEPETIREDGSPCPASEYPVTRALVTGEAQSEVTIGVRRPDGELSWAVFTAVPVKNETGAVTGAVVTFLDVTARRRAQEALQAYEATLRSVVTSAPTIILAADLVGTLTYVNRSADPERTADSWIGTSIYDAVPPSQVQIVRNCVEYVVATCKPSGYEVQVERRGQTIVYSVRVGPVTQHGEVTGITMIATDVTEVKALESRVMISDRLASIGTLAAGVAHEINNPLTYLMLSLERATKALADGERDIERAADSVRAALDGAERIRRLVRDLASLSRSGVDEIEAVNVQAVLDLAIQMSDIETRCRAEVVRRYGDIPDVLGDESRLGQVFLNLLVNAAQAIEEGNVASNEITVTTEVATDGRVRISVADTGRGIDPDLLDHVFEPFVTSKEVGKGTGLGLYICHKIVESLGGELRADNRDSGGAILSVLLSPADRGAATAPSTAHVDQPTSPARGMRILVVDDEEPIRRFFVEDLVDHHVTAASTGREAIAALERSEFDLVFCDLIMPDLTGMDVHDYLSREQPDRRIEVVYMTGGAFTPRAREFLQSGTAQILDKPFSLADVEAIIARHANVTAS